MENKIKFILSSFWLLLGSNAIVYYNPLKCEIWKYRHNLILIATQICLFWFEINTKLKVPFFGKLQCCLNLV